MTTRYGDLLRKLRDPNLPESELNEIQRLFNELGAREEKYKSWLQFADSNPRINAPVMGDPVWTGSPLNLCVIQRLADTVVPNNSATYITFDNVKTFGTAFSVSEDNTKVFWNALDARGFAIHGFVTWEANATGYRHVHLEGFDADGNSLGTSPLHAFQGHSTSDNVFPVSFAYYFNNFSYLQFFVTQTSGGNLTMKDFLLGVTLA